MSGVTGRSGGARPRRPRFECVRVDRLPPRTVREEIVAGLFAPGEVVGLIGPPKSAKSYVALELAAAIAQDRPFLGRPVRRGATIIVAAERYSEWRRRIEATVQPLQAAIYLMAARPALADLDEVDELIASIEAAAQADGEPVALVVIDTIARCMRDLDQNSSRDMGLVADGLTRIVETITTAAVVVVHHTSKGGTDMRGSSALLGALDLELLIGGSGDERKLTVSNANAVAEDQVLPFRLFASAEGEPLRIEAGAAAEEHDRKRKLPARSKEVPIRGDTLAMFEALRTLTNGCAPVDVELWRRACYTAFGDRTSAARRVAFNKGRGILSERGQIVDQVTSVSIAERKRGVSNTVSDCANAYAPDAEEGVSTARKQPSPVGGGAYASLTLPDGEASHQNSEAQVLTLHPRRNQAECKPAGKA